MNDDWRLRIVMTQSGLTHRLGEMLTSEELEHDLESSFHDRIVVSIDGPELFCYAGTREQAEGVQRLVHRLAEQHGWQLDVELAFVEEEDVYETAEAVIGAVFERCGFAAPAPPWPRMTYAEAVSRFGSDRPDTRFGLELKDLGTDLETTGFKVFADTLASGGVVKGINAGARELPRSELDALTELARQHGAKGLVWAFVLDGAESPWRSPIAKFLTESELAAITERLQASPGDLMLIVADQASTAGQALGALRLELART